MKMILMSVPVCLMLIGCATTSQYKSKLDVLKGQSEETLISQWGKPTGRFTLDNGDVLIAYIRSRDIIVPSTPTYAVFSGGGGGNYGGSLGIGGGPTPTMQTSSAGTSGGTMHLSCMTKFIIKNGLVDSSTFKGNDCKTRNW